MKLGKYRFFLHEPYMGAFVYRDLVEKSPGAWYIVEYNYSGKPARKETFVPDFDNDNNYEWLKKYVALEYEYEQGFDVVRYMPELSNVTKCYFSLTQLDKVRAYLCDVFPDDVYLGYSSWGPMGDISFLWVFASKDGMLLTGVGGISYRGGDIGLFEPKTFKLVEKVDVNNTQMLNELVRENFGWIDFKKA